MSTPSSVHSRLRAAADAFARGELADALDQVHSLLEAEPGSSDAWNDLGVYLRHAGEPAAALEAYVRACSLDPRNARACNNAGVILREQGNLAAAERQFVEAQAIDPGYADAASNLGTVCNERGDYAGAVQHLLAALKLNPGHADATGHMGAVLSALRHPEAERYLRRAVQMRPADAEKRLNLGLHLMRFGQFAEGWALYEARWHMPNGELRLPSYPQPRWTGEPLRGSTLLLHAEQGFGDTFQFLRYVPLLLDRGARLVLQVQPVLAGLVRAWVAQAAMPVEVVARSEALPRFDWHAPLLSVPQVIGTTPETIPPPVRLTGPRAPGLQGAGALRVGLVWAGSATNARDHERSLRLAWMEPLLRVAGVQFVSLQYGAAAGQIASGGFVLEQPEITTWEQTAAVLGTLDLVIGVDSAVAHLAAGQGVPTWILLPMAADWRWQLTTPSGGAAPASAWYPASRLFQQQKMAGRQPQEVAWRPVLVRVAAELERLAPGR